MSCGLAPKKLFVEITTAVHENDYLAQRELNDEGFSVGPKLISRDTKTGRITSELCISNCYERCEEVACYIRDRIKDKAAKGYPPGTVLIVNCVPTGLIVDDPEWKTAFDPVRETAEATGFAEIFLYEASRAHSVTFYGKQPGDER